MRTHSHFTVLIAAAVLLGLPVAPAWAQNPGDPIEYRAVRWPEKWETGVFLKRLPGDTQVLVKEKPSQFFPEGFERAYDLADIRPVSPVAAEPAVAPAMARPPATVPAAATVPTGGGPPMTEQDVLGFLSGRLGAGDPFMNPKRESALQDLRAEVLQRGVAFRYQTLSQFSNELGRYGALSNVTAALSENFGAPKSEAELLGNWRLLKVGATTEVTRGGRLYQRQEYAGDAGSLNLSPDGTYSWEAPSGPLKGRWRAATAEEMAKSDKGGPGVVLLAAKGGWDWLVMHRDEEGPEGKGIKVTDLGTRNLRERGTR